MSGEPVRLPREAYFPIGPVEYEKHFCTFALNSIVYLVAALYLSAPNTPEQRAEMEEEAQRFRRLIIRATGRQLPPMLCVWQAGAMGLHWDRS